MDLSRFKQGEGGDFEPAPEGVHAAVCYAVIDLGTQMQSKFQSQEVEEVPLVEVRWEIDEKRDDGKRFIVMKRYRASMHEKASLRIHLEAWRGTAFKDADMAPGGFNMKKLLGQGCQIQIVHNENGKAKIAAIMKLGKGMKAIKPDIEPFIIDLENAEAFDRDAFEALSDNMKTTIAKSPEFQALMKVDGKKSNGAKPSVGSQALAAKKAVEAKQVEHTEDLDDEIPFDEPLAA